MPQATDELRATIDGYFQCGFDLYAPLQFLKDGGWTEKRGWLFAPNREITSKEWHCVDFLCDEWDYAFDASKSATND